MQNLHVRNLQLLSVFLRINSAPVGNGNTKNSRGRRDRTDWRCDCRWSPRSRRDSTSHEKQTPLNRFYISQNVEALVRPTSRMSSILRLKERGLKVHVAEIKDSTKLAEVLVGIHTVISAIGPGAQFEQIPLADASKRANVKLFIPCAFITVCPPGGVMWIRDQVFIFVVK